jgi:DNA-binding CsgD family transcriptional regulator
VSNGAGERLGEAAAALRRGDLDGARAAALAALGEADVPEAHELLATLHFAEDELDDARGHAEQAFRGYRDRGDSRAAALTAIRLADLHDGSFGNSAAARGWLERARRLLQAEGHCVEWGYLELALMACNRDDIVDLEASADRALAIAQEFDDRALEVRALADGGLALVTEGRIKEGFRRLDEAMAALTAGEVTDTRMAGISFCSLLSSCDRAGDVARAEEWIRIVRESVLDHLGGRPVVLRQHCLLAYGSVLRSAGRWEEAEAALVEGLSVGRGGGLGHRAHISACLAAMRVDQGRLEEAADLLAPYEDSVNAAEALARLHLARSEADLAAAVARRGLRMLHGDVLRGAGLLGVLVQTEIARGDLEAAAQAAASLAGAAAVLDTPVVQAERALADGRVRAASGDHGVAVAAFEVALDSIGIDERPLKAGEARLALAGSLAATGDTAAAIVEARAALAAFDRVGACAGADQAAAVLRDLGAPPRTRGHDVAPAVANLTSREADVLDLLRHGLTNAEIAARLYISPKTAEHHVGRVLAKLGVRSRAEAAAIAATLATTPGSQ